MNTPDYRYGYQGQETDRELWDGCVAYKYRIEDPRLGRFFSTDPLAPDYPWNSPYAFSENRVIDGVELEGLEVVSVHSRSFAPFDSFGGGYTGDGNNRKFGDELVEDYDNKRFNYRIRSAVEVNLQTNQILSTTLGKTWSEKPSAGRGAWSPTYFQEPSTFEGGNLFFQMQGNDKALAVPNWLNAGYIDVKVKLNFEQVASDNGLLKWKVAGEVYGDRYPSNETFLTDKSGNQLFLGVSAVDNEGEYGPQKELLGTAFEDMSKFSFYILFNRDETFRGVSLSNGTWYNRDDWNKLFQSLNPKDSNVGTNVTGTGVETDYK